MMAKNDTSPDPELQLKKRARRRLVGAVALALLAVIVLPMVMDHDPRPPVQDIQVRIPSQDTSGIAAKILPARAAPQPLPPVEPKTGLNAASAPHPVPGSGSAMSDKQPVSTPAPAPASVPAAETDRTAPDAEPADAAAQQWAISLGAYKDSGNVRQLLAKLKEMRIPAYTEKFESEQGARTRVRVGPFASREAAEKAQARIKKIGLNGTVTVK